MRGNHKNKNICFLLLFMSATKTHLIVLTYHMCSKEQMPQEPKSMISLNHQAPAVNQDTLVQHYCSSQWAAVLRDGFGFAPKVWVWKVCSWWVGLAPIQSSIPRSPPQMMCLIEVGFSKPDVAVCCCSEKDSEVTHELHEVWSLMLNILYPQ